MYFIAGRDITITVPFVVDGDTVIPDVDTVKYTLRDNTGVDVPGYVDVPVTTTLTTTEVHLVLPAAVNAKTLTIENRFVIVDFETNDRAYTQILDYRLVDFLLYTTTPQDVRNLLGVSVSELADDAVDLVKAYYDVADQLTAVALLTALKAGNRNTQLANQAIAATAALEAIPSLQLAIAAEEGTDSTKYRRLQKIDFAALAESIRSMLGGALQALGGGDAVIPIISVFGTRTDAVTGT